MAVGASVGVAVALPFLLGAAAGAPDPAGTPVLRFGDPDIVESSGLAFTATARGGLVHTVNDSGDSGRVFTVDTATGSTVGVTSWDADPLDVEALAPAGRGHVWVADIGDNRRVRDSVEVLRVPVGPGERTVTPEAYELVYPDGPRDAEALLADPLTGRLHVVTKGVFAGTVYAAPARLRADRSHRLVEVAEAPGIVTDATFLPGGGGVVMRTYSTAHSRRTRRGSPWRRGSCHRRTRARASRTPWGRCWSAPRARGRRCSPWTCRRRQARPTWRVRPGRRCAGSPSRGACRSSPRPALRRALPARAASCTGTRAARRRPA